LLSTAPSKKALLRVVAATPGVQVSLTFEQIYRRFSPYVAAIVLRLDPRAPDPEDLVQDIFLEAARGLRRLRDPAAVKSWLRTVCVRLVRRRLRLRRMWRWLGIEDDAGQRPLLIDAGTSAPDRLLLERVYQVLDQMAVEDRLAFVLHHIEGETLETVAHLCRCSLATTKRRIARAQHGIEQRLGVDGEGRSGR
jgi:RNA polymerase sigma-70 factor, ECF subfamily